MNQQFWWYVARASGLVAWALATMSVLWGLALATRALGSKPRAPGLLDLHRYLGGLTVLFVLAHMGALVADTYVEFGIRELLVPFASEWRTGAVAWGIVAFYGLAAIELSSLVKRRIPTKVWHGIHLTSYLVFIGATVHLFTAGTDAGNPAVVLGVVGAVAATGFFTVYRWVGPGRAASVRSGRRSPSPARAAADPSGSPRPATRVG